MPLFPVSTRELQVAARQRSTYVSRLGAAGVSLMIFAWLLWITPGNRGPSGMDLFTTFSWIAFIYCSVAGAVLTADCISGEKREDTLGLLFLTDLNAPDIALGKLLGATLNCWFGLLAMLPIMAVPVLMGGVTLQDLIRVFFTLTNTLVLSSSIGLLLSSVNRNALRATSGALTAMFLLAVGLFLLALLLEQHYGLTGPAKILRWFSPLSCMNESFYSGFRLRSNSFRISSAIMVAMSLSCLAITCLILPHAWKDRSGSGSAMGWRLLWRRFHSGTASARRALRTRWLDLNPYYWIAHGGRFGPAGFVLFLLLLCCAAIWTGWRFPANFGHPSPTSALTFTWLWAVFAGHVLFLIRIATLAPHRFSMDRRAGGLELILATPIAPKRILAGNTLALARNLVTPAIFLLLMHGMLLVVFLEMATFESGPGLDLWTRVHGILEGDPAGNHHFRRSDLLIFLSLFGSSAFLLFCSWITLAWVGMWIGLWSNRPRLAPWQTLALVVVPPWIVFFVVIAIMEEWRLFSDPEWSFAIGLSLAMSLTVLHHLGLCLWAWRGFHSRFRIAVTDRTLLKRPPRTWADRRRIALRFAVGFACLCGAVRLFYLEEHYRGQREWNRFLTSESVPPESYQLGSATQPRTLDASSFAAAPMFASLSHGHISRSNSPILSSDQLMAVNIEGTQRWSFLNRDARLGSWFLQKPTDLIAWQRHFTNRIVFPQPTGPALPAEHVLTAITKFEGELELMTQAAQRPDSATRYGNPNPPVDSGELHRVLENFSELFHLRASAHLALNQYEPADANLEVLLRLVNTIQDEPTLEAQQLRTTLAGNAIQVLWEGFNHRAWSSNQLAALQSTLAEFDFVTDYHRTARQVTIENMSRWAGLRDMIPRMRTNALSALGQRRLERYLFYPLGWTYLNPIRISQYHTRYLEPIASPETGQIHPDLADVMLKARHKSGPLVYEPGSRMPNRFRQLAVDVARVQTAAGLGQLACAIERHRFATGTLPGTLQALVPDFFPRLPVDPVGGAPLKYTTTPDGQYTLYGVGWNEIDDQGPLRKETDWVWVITPPRD
jgi:ABC-type Na+ efflux pump permease subunit